MLLIHGRYDETVPISQSEQMLAALKLREIAAELVVVEDAGHGLKMAGPKKSGPGRQDASPELLARYERISVDFFKRTFNRTPK